MNITDENLIIVLVGLPSRGKTSISKHLYRYLSWIGYSTSLLIKEDYLLKDNNSNKEKVEQIKLTFTDKQSLLIEESDIHLLLEASYFITKDNGQIVILDSDNISKDQRDITRKVLKENIINRKYHILFFEIINDNKEKIDEVIKVYCMNCPLYKNMSLQDSIVLQNQKIELQRNYYSSLSEEENVDGAEVSYIKGWRHSSFLKAYNISKGYLLSKITGFIMNLKLELKKHIYLINIKSNSSNTESILLDEKLKINKRSSNEEKEDMIYVEYLKDYFEKENLTKKDKIKLYSSTYGNSYFISKRLSCYLNLNEENVYFLKSLDNMSIGLFDEINQNIISNSNKNSMNEIENSGERRKMNLKDSNKKLENIFFRFDHGESYFDVILRLDQVIHDLERSGNICLILADDSIIKCIYAYFKSININEIPLIELSDKCIIKLEDSVYKDNIEERISYSKYN